MKILSFDPGEKNFAYSMNMHRSDPILRHKIVKNGLVSNCINNLKTSEILEGQHIKFSDEILGMLTTFKPDYVVMERFMGRGLKVGTTSETTNIMIGIIITLCRQQGIPFKLVNASTWKNAYNKARSKFVTSNIKDEYKLIGTTPHQYDATMIGIYYAHVLCMENPFKRWADDMVRDSIMASIEKSSEVKLVQRRVKRVYA